ncbi:unnamed protein product [Angiostrongylus costaricensis]|uniref:EGF-like domain-containing protein n=1 Tax=Angiostrongylus costaricensis TaxID=334426 RepID=A0A0R3PP80_ANGCS|nr:unnamed protein product [Angiostrongylus costaricensis]
MMISFDDFFLRNNIMIFSQFLSQVAESVACEKSQDYVCRNGAVCERHSGRTVCICKQGFSGKYCQFTLRPRTCAEALSFHGLGEGPVQLDVDGSRPLYSSVAVCRNGTYVPYHLLGYIVNKYYASGLCRQQVLYDCNRAALGFESRRTWFNSVARNRSIAQIGRIPNSCPCMDMGCIENSKKIIFSGDRPIRFSKPQALPIGNWRGEPLSLQFRTAVASAIVFSVQDGNDVVLNAKLINGKLLSFVFFRYNEPNHPNYSRASHFLCGEEETKQEVNTHKQSVIYPLVTNTLNRIGLYLNCEDRCNSNFCQNSGECIEDFASDGVLCRCKYSNVQSGRNCEIDINQNSSVSFNGGFLKYELLRNPLVDQTVISFRTDQSHALILFVHDHHNNFMQLHLSEEVNLTLSLNNEAIVSSCTVRARPGTEFSNMEWIQVHSTQLSTLTVDDDACSIHAARKLSEKPVQKFINVFTDGSMVLRPIYQCAIANLFGCVRGMKVGGEVINLRLTVHGNRPSDPKAIRSGCDMGCDTLDCKNGGHCSVAWRKGEEVSCDCSRTSYAGPQCTIGKLSCFLILEGYTDIQSTRPNASITLTKRRRTLRKFRTADYSRMWLTTAPSHIKNRCERTRSGRV